MSYNSIILGTYSSLTGSLKFKAIDFVVSLFPNWSSGATKIPLVAEWPILIILSAVIG